MLDLYHEMQVNATLYEKLDRLTGALDALHQKYGSNAPFMQETANIIYAIFVACDYNVGLLFPYFFPTAIMGQPLSLMNRPFAFAMTKMHLFGSLTMRGSRQISKTTTFGGLLLCVARLISDLSCLYICPRSDNLKTFQTKLKHLDRHFRYPEVETTKFRQNLGLKEYSNGSVIEAIYVNETADNARGKSSDLILWDETQNMDVNLLPELREIQTASKMPSNIYAGTSLTTDTMLEAKYEDSSQGTFWVKDGTAKGYIDCGDVDAILKMIKPQGLTCPTTNKPINIRDIRLVHKFQARADAGVVGIHVPKIIVPEFVEDPIEWNKLYGTFLEYEKIGQLKKFIQEVLGIPVEDGVRELTQADLEHMCCIPETPAQMEANVHRGVYKFTVAGIDWGGSDYNPADKTKLSYTFHIILGVRADGKIDILYMEKHAGMDYQGIINIIATMNKRYNVTYIGSDHAAGTLYNSAFRKHPHVKSLGHFVIQYSGNMLQLINKVKDSALENHYAVQKTDTLTDTIMAIKQEFPRIRCFKWELAKRYLDDFMNFRRVIEDRDEGGSKFRYRRHGSKPDDGIHALNFAYIVVRMVRNEPFVQDNSLRIEIYNQIRMITNGGNALAGYTPGMHTVSG